MIIARYVAWGVLAGGICLLHWLFPSPGPDDAGLMSLAHSAYTLLLSTFVICIGAGLGRVLLGRIPICEDLDPLESIVVSFGLGIGVIAISVFVLGAAGAFRPIPIAGLLVIAAGVSSSGLGELGLAAGRSAEMLASDWRQARAAYFIVIGIAGVIFLLALVLALAPPWAYDGLMYHLQAPRLFLQQGRVVALPTILQANGPLLGQMLFGIGLALGSDSFSQVIHLSYAVGLVLLVLAAGRRWMGPPGGWLAAGVLVGIPIFPLLGTLAYVDMIHAFYEFLAVWAILRWNASPRPAWLGLSAIMAGMAIGTKLVGLLMVPALCVWLVFLARRQGWVRALVTAGAYGLAVGVVGVIWYGFSLVSTGDPFFPLLRGGSEWPASRLALHTDYLQSFGTGRGVLDFVQLPVNLYVHHEAFATMMQTIEFPSFLFPLALLAPFVAMPGPLRPLVGFSLLRLTTWYLGSQQTRFLLPLYPAFSLMAAAVLLAIEARIRRGASPPRFSAAIVAGLVVTTLVYGSIYFYGTAPLPSVLGLRPRSAFLEHMVGDYRALEYIKSETSASDRVLQLWDGQGYYCDERCISDPGQVLGPYLHSVAPTVEAMTFELAARGVTHVLVELESLSFLIQHDPKGTHRAAGEFFLTSYLPECGRLQYEDSFTQVYRLTCGDGG